MADAWRDSFWLQLSFYETREAAGPATSPDGNEYRFQTTKVLQEQPSNLVGELALLLEDEEETTETERRLRDTVARMELVLAELTDKDPVEMIALFGASREKRCAARLTELMGIVRGQHSTLYRILVD